MRAGPATSVNARFVGSPCSSLNSQHLFVSTSHRRPRAAVLGFAEGERVRPFRPGDREGRAVGRQHRPRGRLALAEREEQDSVSPDDGAEGQREALVGGRAVPERLLLRRRRSARRAARRGRGRTCGRRGGPGCAAPTSRRLRGLPPPGTPPQGQRSRPLASFPILLLARAGCHALTRSGAERVSMAALGNAGRSARPPPDFVGTSPSHAFVQA